MGSQNKRTQAERRRETYNRVLETACRLFGEKGYADTSLEDIAGACGLTTRPVYHYFGNKKKLFAAVNSSMTERIINTMVSNSYGDASMLGPWQAFLELCEDSAFRQIVLIDSPNILGRDRWRHSPVTRKAAEWMSSNSKTEPDKAIQQQLKIRMTIGALAEAALFIAEAEGEEGVKKQAEQLVAGVLKGLGW